MTRSMKAYNETEYGLGVFPDYEEPDINFIPSYKRCSNEEEEKISFENEYRCYSEI